jgi:hypothetical protein
MAGVRARRRPRRQSVNFRRLWWVLTRQAALCILCPDAGEFALRYALRRELARRDTARVRTVAGIVLALYPERQMWPPPRP